MSDSAKLRCTYGIIWLIIGTACFIVSTIFTILSILIDEGFAFLAFFPFITGIISMKNSVCYFIECGKIQGRNEK